MRRRRNLEIIAGRFNGADGVITAGDGFNVVRNSTGAYTIYFPEGFRVISFHATLQQADRPYYVGLPADRAVGLITVTGIGGAGYDPPAVWFTAVGTQK